MKTFYLLNRGSNGQLTVDEMKYAFYNNGFNLIKEEEINSIFSMIDLDGQGTVCYAEFIVTCLSYHDIIEEESCQRSFKTFKHIFGDDSLVEVK